MAWKTCTEDMTRTGYVLTSSKPKNIQNRRHYPYESSTCAYSKHRFITCNITDAGVNTFMFASSKKPKPASFSEGLIR